LPCLAMRLSENSPNSSADRWMVASWMHMRCAYSQYWSSPLELPSAAAQQHIERRGRAAECRSQSAATARMRAAPMVGGGALLRGMQSCMWPYHAHPTCACYVVVRNQTGCATTEDASVLMLEGWQCVCAVALKGSWVVLRRW
jgi:hypothetical protein